MQNFNNIHELAGIFGKDDMNVLLTDLVYPYVTDERDIRGFAMTPLKPAYKLTFESLIKENSVGIMADHVAFDAKGVARKTKGFKVTEGQIPNIVAHRAIDKNDYLEIMKTLNDVVNANDEIKTATQETMLIVSEMQGVVGKMTRSMLAEHNNRVSWMRGQAVSKGEYSVTPDTNSSSFTIPTIKFGIPDAAKVVLTGNNRFWTNAERTTEGSTSDPMAAFRAMIKRGLQNKRLMKSDFVIECEYWTLMDLAAHSKVLLAYSKAMNSAYVAAGVTDAVLLDAVSDTADEDVIAWMEKKLGVSFLVSNQVVAVQKLNEKTGIFEDKTMSTFEPNRFTLRRKGNIGEIHRTAQITVSDGASGMNIKLNGGDILLKYKCNADAEAQQWDTQEIVLPVLTDVNNMQLLQVM